MRRLLCAIFQHRWDIPTGDRSFDPVTCQRCGHSLLQPDPTTRPTA